MQHLLFKTFLCNSFHNFFIQITDLQLVQCDSGWKSLLLDDGYKCWTEACFHAVLSVTFKSPVMQSYAVQARHENNKRCLKVNHGDLRHMNAKNWIFICLLFGALLKIKKLQKLSRIGIKITVHCKDP